MNESEQNNLNLKEKVSREAENRGRMNVKNRLFTALVVSND